MQNNTYVLQEFSMDWRKTKRKVLIVIAMLLVLGMASFLYGFFDNAAAPHLHDGDDHALNAGISVRPGSDGDAPSAAMNDPEQTAHPSGHIVLPAPAHENHFMVRMNPSDIFRGNLLLVNHDHRFDPPDTQGFVSIASEITPSYGVTGDDLRVAASVIEPLNNMMDSFFAATGRDTVTVISAYRGYERQQEILNEYIALVGSIEALRWAALPGHTEHHTGLAVDFGLQGHGGLRTFLGTGVYSWFVQNSHSFGFILRFPGEKSDITNTAYEPWHFRYIGLPHSLIIHYNDWCLEEYIEHVTGYTRNNPLIEDFNGSRYEIYFTMDREIIIPNDSEFDISGNNINGFIVTIKQ